MNESGTTVRLWNPSARVDMDVQEGAVTFAVAGPAWERGLHFSVPLERLQRAVTVLQAEQRMRDTERLARQQRAVRQTGLREAS